MSPRAFPPSLKVDAEIAPITHQALTPDQARDLAYSVMNEEQIREFEANKECNFALNPVEIGRFRVNVFVQQNRVGMVLRNIETHIPEFEDLRLPGVMREIAMAKRGLVIFVGGTGTGKSTSMASLVGYRNEHSHGHIITIEDPIEYVHEHRNCIITQREIGIDTDSWETALTNAMRQAPDVIQIGEIRHRETMDHAVVFAETGHLCIATLHANNTYQALDRIINFFPADRRDQLLMDLSLNLKALVSQRLLPIENDEGRVPAVEVMLNTPLIADMILKGRVDEIRDVIGNSRERGMQTFDQSLFDLYEADLVSYDDAVRNADSENDLRLRVKLKGKHANSRELGDSMKNVTF
ncbi:MAG: Twitching mobility protein [Gammaproteobacteria bacterium]|nr:Twitching mobility protein [Gammaproteobacteria bacterium]